MVRRASGGFGHDTVKAKRPQIERIHERIDDTHWVVLTDPVVQALGKQGGLAAIHAFNKASHRIPPNKAGLSYHCLSCPAASVLHNQGQLRKKTGLL